MIKAAMPRRGRFTLNCPRIRVWVHAQDPRQLLVDSDGLVGALLAPGVTYIFESEWAKMAFASTLVPPTVDTHTAVHTGDALWGTWALPS